MATLNPTYVWDHSSDAAYRTWAQNLSANLKAVGLIQMGDTGQWNALTALRPTAGSTGSSPELYQLSVWADPHDRVDGALVTTKFGKAYLASSGGDPLPRIVSQRVQAAAAPTNASFATALVDVGTQQQSVDFDTITSAATADTNDYWTIRLRYTDDNNQLFAQFVKAAGAWSGGIYKKIGGGQTTLVSGVALGATDPSHLRGEIDATGAVILRFNTGGNATATPPVASTGQQTINYQLTAGDNAALGGTQCGYQITSTSVLDNFCAADSAPVFLQVYYGTHPTNTTTPAVLVSAGVKSNGANSLVVGPTTARAGAPQSPWNGATVAQPSWFCCTGDYFMMLLAPQAATSAPILFYVFEKTRDAAGAANNHGAVIVSTTDSGWSNFNGTTGNNNNGRSANNLPSGTPGGWWEAYYNFSNYLTSSSTHASVFESTLNLWGSSSDGTNTYFWPHVVMTPRWEKTLAMLACVNSDVTAYTTLSLNALGSAHTYFVASAGLFTPDAIGGHGLLVRYE